MIVRDATTTFPPTSASATKPSHRRRRARDRPTRRFRPTLPALAGARKGALRHRPAAPSARTRSRRERRSARSSSTRMIALLYFATAVALLFLADRFISPISRGAALALLLLPLIFTGRAVFTGGVYAPVELPYDVPPLAEHRAELRVPPDRNPMLTDIAFIIIPWREAVRRAVREGEWPLLNRFELCGEP